MAHPGKKRQTLHSLRLHLHHNDHERPPAPPPFDPAISAILDHLLMIEGHLEVIDERFTSVQSLVEELIP